MEKDIRKIIIEELSRQGMSYKALADAIGCTPRTVFAWRAGTRGISLDLADKALKVLGLSITIGEKEEK